MIRRTCPVLSITPQRSPARGCRPAGPNQGRALRTVECLRHVSAPDHRHRDLRQPQAVADHINQRHGPLRRFFRIRTHRSQQAKRKKQNPFPYIGSENSWNLPTFYYIYTTLTTLQHGCKDRPRLARAARSRIRKTLLRRPHRSSFGSEYATRRIYPRGSNIFRAFDKCPFDKLKVVIIGQDPYHGRRTGQRTLLLGRRRRAVPALAAEYLSRRSPTDTGTPPPATGNLDRWAEQGVLLLNAVLTVRAHRSGVARGPRLGNLHRRRGTHDLRTQNRASFTCFGAVTPRSKGAIAESAERNFILKAVHPSPLSVYRGFFGCRHFSRANEYLLQPSARSRSYGEPSPAGPVLPVVVSVGSFRHLRRRGDFGLRQSGIA